MKLVRFDGGKTGLMVQFPSGSHVIDVVGSLAALSPDDPISQGVLKLASANPDGPHLVVRRVDAARLALPFGDPISIATLDIAEFSEVAQDPTGREAMARNFSVQSPAAEARVTAIIPFKDKKRSVEVFLPLQGS